VANGLSFGAALEIVAASTVFTTHTPVAAGHDVFTHGQLHHWLGDYLGSLHTAERRLLALGLDAGGSHRFSMTALALRTSRFHNAVSRVHRDVAARMEAYVWPRVPPAENPVGHVTNAVHLPTFLAPEWIHRFDQHVPDWRARPLADSNCAWLDRLGDGEFEAIRRESKRRLLKELRDRLEAQHRQNGLPQDPLMQALALLDPARDGTLVLGFARRFATYKRAALLLSDPQRLARLLNLPERPALLVFAGKAHPHDQLGQQLLHGLYESSLRPEFLGRLLVVGGYDLALARGLVQGCDVWLNTPEYPLEASGTSGMKAGINGGVNVSILDGWWAEGCDSANGYGIAPVDAPPDERDRQEAQRLFDVLETGVWPLYFGDRPGWLRMSRHAMRSLIPRFGGARMLADYVRGLYAPAARHGERLRERHCRAAIEFKRWKKMIRMQHDGVRVSVTGHRPLRAAVTLNGLMANDFVVELKSAQGAETLALVREDREQAQFEAKGDVARPAQLRVIPVHPLLAHRFELGMLAVADLAA
jgi:starch phosphorylase